MLLLKSNFLNFPWIITTLSVMIHGLKPKQNQFLLFNPRLWERPVWRNHAWLIETLAHNIVVLKYQNICTTAEVTAFSNCYGIFSLNTNFLTISIHEKKYLNSNIFHIFEQESQISESLKQYFFIFYTAKKAKVCQFPWF